MTCPFEVLRIRAIEAASAEMAPIADTRGAGSDAAAPTPVGAPVGAHAAANAGDGRGSSTASAPSSPPPPQPLASAPSSPPQPLPASAYTLANGLGTLYAEGGVGTLYSALTPLLLRELPFTITKFLVYDSATQAIAAAFPLAQEGPAASALLSLTGGLAAGVVAAAVSTPADTLLTLSQAPPSAGAEADADGSAPRGPPSMIQILRETLATNPLGLFNGLLPRCVFFGALIAGQFLLYDEVKALFKVGSGDIVFYLDVFASTDLSFWPRSRDL